MHTIIDPYGKVYYVGNLNENFELHGKGSIFTTHDKKNHIWTGIFTNNMMIMDKKHQSSKNSYCVNKKNNLKNMSYTTANENSPGKAFDFTSNRNSNNKKGKCNQNINQRYSPTIIKDKKLNPRFHYNCDHSCIIF